MWEGRLFAFVGDNPQQRRKILNYRYSSAGFYATGHDEFGLMTILAEWRGAYCPVRNTGTTMRLLAYAAYWRQNRGLLPG